MKGMVPNFSELVYATPEFEEHGFGTSNENGSTGNDNGLAGKELTGHRQIRQQPASGDYKLLRYKIERINCAQKWVNFIGIKYLPK